MTTQCVPPCMSALWGVTDMPPQDFIADFALSAEQHTLLSAGGDGRLGVYDLRKWRMVAMSDEQEDELLSVCIMKACRAPLRLPIDAA